MRKKIIAGNWKMNLTYDEAAKLFSEVQKGLVKNETLDRVLIFPAYPYIFPLSELKKKEFIHLGAQNIASQPSGAFTGEVSAAMLQSIGLKYALIGHSERRMYFGENEVVLKRKLDLALLHDISPVFCCGESLFDRKNGKQEIVIENQLHSSVFHIDKKEISRVIIAYEPVWAIGTGETATSKQAEEMHAFIRSLLRQNYGDDIAAQAIILYGGSCNASNAAELFACKNVDGGLIGGASLKSDEFLKIIAAVHE